MLPTSTTRTERKMYASPRGVLRIGDSILNNRFSRKKPKLGDCKTTLTTRSNVLANTTKVEHRAVSTGLVLHRKCRSSPCTLIGAHLDGKILTSGKNIPKNAIVGGTDTDGSQLWVARAYYDGGIRKSITSCRQIGADVTVCIDPGKAFLNARRGAVVSYGGKEVEASMLFFYAARTMLTAFCRLNNTRSLSATRTLSDGFSKAAGLAWITLALDPSSKRLPIILLSFTPLMSVDLVGAVATRMEAPSSSPRPRTRTAHSKSRILSCFAGVLMFEISQPWQD